MDMMKEKSDIESLQQNTKMKRILLVNHNALRNDTNNGKTLSELFKMWDSEKIAQLYFHPEMPDSKVCDRFYQITDRDIAKRLAGQKTAGRMVQKQNGAGVIKESNPPALMKLKRYHLTYLLRDMLWSTGMWKSKELTNWLDSFSPEVIFLIMPGISFSAKIAIWISQRYNIPIVLYITDDYYNNHEKTVSPFYHLFQRRLKKTILETVTRTKHMITLNRKMDDVYSEIFKVPSTVIYTPSTITFRESNEFSNDGILYYRYFGNLGLGRWETLVELGKAIAQINRDGTRAILEVYSGERNAKIIENLDIKNGSCFKGWVSGKEYFDLLYGADVVIHAESFKEKNSRRTELSLSTKIADYLGAGKCILAIGPKHLASMIHLENIAVEVNSPDDISSAVKKLIDDPSLRYKCRQLSLAAGTAFHRADENCSKLQEVIEGI